MRVKVEHWNVFCFTPWTFGFLLPTRHLVSISCPGEMTLNSSLSPLSSASFLLANEDPCPWVDKKRIRFGILASFQKKLKRVGKTGQAFLVMFLVCLWIPHGIKSKTFPTVSKGKKNKLCCTVCQKFPFIYGCFKKEEGNNSTCSEGKVIWRATCQGGHSNSALSLWYIISKKTQQWNVFRLKITCSSILMSC